MKEYPKVPPYYNLVFEPHNTYGENHTQEEIAEQQLYLEDPIFDAEDLLILEKTDGQNFRIILYVSELDDKYSEEVKDFEPKDGEVFIGTKKNIQGRLSDSPSSFDFEFEAIINYLRSNLDTDRLREHQKQYEKPLVLFGEHMVPHSLDYEYLTNPPPIFLGFDIFPQHKADIEKPHNPLKETFEGFLEFDTVQEIYKDIGLDSIEPLDRDPSIPVDPHTYEIPQSNYADITAEGVILRSDSLNKRVKITTGEFEERNMYIWGMREDQADSGAELFVAKYVTNSRIHKQIYDYIHQEKTLTAEEIAENVLIDAFTEEWSDISGIDKKISMPELWKEATKRSKNVIEQMQTRSEFHQEELTELYEMKLLDDSKTTASQETTSQTSHQFSVTNTDKTESEIIDFIVSEELIIQTAETIAETEGRELGPWTIPQVYKKLEEQIWIEHRDLLLSLDTAFCPRELNSTLMNRVSTTLS